MRTVFFLLTAAAVCLTGPSISADDQSTEKSAESARHDPTGTWVWETEVAGAFIESQLRLALDDDGKLTGEYSDQNVSLEISKGAFDGKTVTFSLEFDVDGNEVQADFSGTADGDSLKGLTKLTLNGEPIDLPIDARRRTSRRDVVGKWELSVETDNGEFFEPTVTLELRRGRLVGTYSDAAAGDHELSDVTLKNNVLTLVVEGEAPDGARFRAEFRGKPRGNRLEGKADVVINDNELTAAVTGRRVATKDDSES